MNITSPTTAPHIMIVDDNQMMRSFLSSFLIKKGYQLTMATHGMEALTLLRRGTYPDLIITDIRMPVLDGMKFLDRLQASPLLKEIPVVILSGQDSSEDRIACLERGAVDVLTKPFNPIELDLRIRRFVPMMDQATN
jgi:CheY-like chemotaxis protein